MKKFSALRNSALLTLFFVSFAQARQVPNLIRDQDQIQSNFSSIEGDLRRLDRRALMESPNCPLAIPRQTGQLCYDTSNFNVYVATAVKPLGFKQFNTISLSSVTSNPPLQGAGTSADPLRLDGTSVTLSGDLNASISTVAVFAISVKASATAAGIEASTGSFGSVATTTMTATFLSASSASIPSLTGSSMTATVLLKASSAALAGLYVTGQYSGPALQSSTDNINTTALNSSVKAYRSGNQTISSGGTPLRVQFNAEAFDQAGEFDTSTAAFLTRRAGIYFVHAAVRLDVSVDTSLYAIYIYKNGSVYSVKRVTGSTTAGITIDITDTLSLAIGDRLHIEFQAGEPSRDLLSGEGATYFIINKLQ